MKNFSMGRLDGFTLIELLVVVLIIGILSAIALPQYTTAVEKARATEAVQNITMMEKQIDLYIMENGYQSADYKDFAGGTLSGGSWDNTGYDAYLTKNFEYWARVDTSNGGSIEVYRTLPDGSQPYTFVSSTVPIGYNRDSPTGGWYRACVTQLSDLGRKVCRQFEGSGWAYADNEL